MQEARVGFRRSGWISGIWQEQCGASWPREVRTGLRNRSLRLEALEPRTLLSVTVLDTSFKSAEFQGSMEISGSYSEGPFWVSFRGRAEAQGEATFDSPQHGTGYIEAQGNGTFRSSVGSGRVEFGAEAEGEYDHGVICGTGSAWIDIAGVGRYEQSGSGCFEFDPARLQGVWDYRDEGLVVHCTARLRPMADEPFGITFPQVAWIDPAQPRQGIELTVAVAGPVHAAPSSTTPVTHVRLYWARGSSLFSRTTRLGDSIPIYWNQAGGVYRVTDLPAAPAGSTHLLVIAQYDGRTSFQALALPSAPSTPLPAVSINDVQATEGHSGLRAAVFTVSLSAPSSQTVVVRYATAGVTARPWSDYQPIFSGTIAIPPGATQGTISVQIVGDRSAESNETFVVNLLSARNATISDRQGIGTIVDDDQGPLQAARARDMALAQWSWVDQAWSDAGWADRAAWAGLGSTHRKKDFGAARALVVATLADSSPSDRSGQWM